ncbi:hypothetical protein KI387_019223, partial [Taxus chinensis]
SEEQKKEALRRKEWLLGDASLYLQRWLLNFDVCLTSTSDELVLIRSGCSIKRGYFFRKEPVAETGDDLELPFISNSLASSHNGLKSANCSPSGKKGRKSKQDVAKKEVANGKQKVLNFSNLDSGKVKVLSNEACKSYHGMLGA